ncbi:hypothetical protein [Candidatus Palauibacter sp.]|uniref:hypothetical protein n=1 Tax=Candidatus Palauibacter sp. TaxID=3101350 RepID=UPI003B02B8B2
MNRIEDERIKFYLEHETRIREWAKLEPEVCKFVDRFYRSLEGDLAAAVRSDKIADDGVEVFLADVNPDWPGLVLRRQDWPQGDEEPDVRLGWSRKSVRFSANGWLGVRTSVKRYRTPFTKEARPAYPLSSPSWPAYRDADPPKGRFWEGDNLKEYREHLVETILAAWNDLAPLVDEAVGHRSG